MPFTYPCSERAPRGPRPQSLKAIIALGLFPSIDGTNFTMDHIVNFTIEPLLKHTL